MENGSKKLCPLFIARSCHDVYCIQEDCMLYVKAQKLHLNVQWVFWKGCGLIHNIPWRIAKKEKAPA